MVMFTSFSPHPIVSSHREKRERPFDSIQRFATLEKMKGNNTDDRSVAIVAEIIDHLSLLKN